MMEMTTDIATLAAIVAALLVWLKGLGSLINWPQLLPWLFRLFLYFFQTEK
ncbi:hypothetical protein [Brevibacillus laterosporus]|uniref:hypothetical protein n=1 Tax=Brevibacillus laterosporus TaxID=1465 RepID=UPI002E23D5BF|nr:hypothetical protein [Brevibacillus laterosporus]